jgi:hypothetical protein
VLSGSHENMATLENTLMLRVSEFVTSMNEVTASSTDVTSRVENNISNFRDITARVVGDLGQLALQFDAHGRELGQAIALIERSNTRSEQFVSDRRNQIEQLVGTLDGRTQDMEERLTRFTGLLEESLQAAAIRARDVARLVSESSADGVRVITEQYARVRETAEEERRRTSDAMQSVFAQATGETADIFSGATERFTEVVSGMKQMAAEMRNELESTRTELRRGIFDLPQETAESAAQMRRVIVDQIQALAELNRIVARHGRDLDAAEPRRAMREEPALALAGARSDLPAARVEAPPPPRPTVPPRLEPIPRPSAPRPEPSFAPSAPSAPPPPAAPPRRADATPSAPIPPPTELTRGWLTELLSRASRDEEEQPEFTREPQRGGPEERTPRHSIESLDSLSVDIARMIDHEAAADLWERYKRGERNVFTRQLYTMQGQNTFEEIRRKYRTDREFRQTVDRYIGEFEQLLDEVSRDDRSQTVARTYLNSETGKVYTMLAHAAGKFD